MEIVNMQFFIYYSNQYSYAHYIFKNIKDLCSVPDIIKVTNCS